MSRRERKLVECIMQESEKLLWAIGYAETYMARVALSNAIADRIEFLREAQSREAAR